MVLGPLGEKRERGGRAGGGLRGKGKQLGLALIWWGLAGENDEDGGVLHVAVLALDGDRRKKRRDAYRSGMGRCVVVHARVPDEKANRKKEMVATVGFGQEQEN